MMEIFPSGISEESPTQESKPREISGRDQMVIDSIRVICQDIVRLFEEKEPKEEKGESFSYVGEIGNGLSYVYGKFFLSKGLFNLLEENEESLSVSLTDPEKREEIFGYFCLLADLDYDLFNRLGLGDKVTEFIFNNIEVLEGSIERDKFWSPNFLKVSRVILASSNRSTELPAESKDLVRLKSLLRSGVKNMTEEWIGLEISDEKSVQLVEKYKDLILMCLGGELEEGGDIKDQIVSLILLDQLDEKTIAPVLERWLEKHLGFFDDYEGQGFYVVDKILSHFGFNEEQVKEIIEFWVNNGHFNFIGSELLSIRKLEKEALGVTKYLRENFGIRCFSRYEETLLLEQYKNREEELSDVGVFITGAEEIDSWTTKPFLSGLAQKLSTLGVGTIIVESRDKIELLKILSRLSRRVSEKQFSFLFVNAHGSENSISLSRGEEEKSYLHTESFFNTKESVRQRMSAFLKPGAQIFFSSCLIGVDGGIADKISSELKTPTISCPLKVFRIKKYDVEKNPNGAVRFTGVEYSGTNNDKEAVDVRGISR